MDLSAKETLGEPEDKLKLSKVKHRKKSRSEEQSIQELGKTTQKSVDFFLRGQIVNILAI